MLDKYDRELEIGQRAVLLTMNGALVEITGFTKHRVKVLVLRDRYAGNNWGCNPTSLLLLTEEGL